MALCLFIISFLIEIMNECSNYLVTVGLKYVVYNEVSAKNIPLLHVHTSTSHILDPDCCSAYGCKGWFKLLNIDSSRCKVSYLLLVSRFRIGARGVVNFTRHHH